MIKVVDCMNKLEYKFFDFFKKFKLHTNVYVGYSGGIDSSVLLYLSNKFFKQNMFFLKAVHVNHSYGKHSFFWTVFCKNFCDYYKIPIHVFTSFNFIDKNIEEQFRFVRFNFFLNLISKNSSLLLAHNSDDFLETFFLRLLRGANFKSIFGSDFKSKIGKLNIIRPFSDIGKSDIRDFAISNKIDYISDFSNFNIKFSRNYLRNKILPLVILKWPSFNKNIFKFYLITNSFYLYFYNRQFLFIKSNAFNFDFLDVKYLLLLPIFIRYEVIRLWIKLNSYNMPSYVHFKELDKILSSREKNNGFILVKNYFLKKKGNYLFITKKVVSYKSFFKISIHYYYSKNSVFFVNNISSFDNNYVLKNEFIYCFIKFDKSFLIVLGVFYSRKFRFFLKNNYLFKVLF